MDRARRAQPFGTRTAQRRHMKIENELHKKRLARIRPSVDNRMPSTLGLSKNRKREIERERRLQHIEMENRLLLERLSKAMSKKTIDNESKHGRFRRSLTQTHRRLELERISQENQRLLRRIQRAEPCYNHLKWEEDAQRHAKYLKTMCEYPVVVGETAEEREVREHNDSGAGDDREFPDLQDQQAIEQYQR